ncbi:MAG: hypothetical protein AAFQ95_23130 [Cyanobacteria bacterium J06621_3]
MDIEALDQWFEPTGQQQLIAQIARRVGLTRTRAIYFVRLWIYLNYKQHNNLRDTSDMPGLGFHAAPPRRATTQPTPFTSLKPITDAISCSHSEAAWLFYGDKDQGSDRAAGMMLDKLAALGLIQKHFDGNTTRITIQLDSSNLLPTQQPSARPLADAEQPSLITDDFDPRCDAVPVANLLAINYSWMNRSLEIVPHRITRLLRRWANQYAVGMRVLRRSDNLNPVGFYLLYPTTADSEVTFSSSPTKGLHLASMNEVDPFTLATPGDPDCAAIFVRSWMIDPAYLEEYRVPFLQDAQQTLKKMQKDFPNLCDLYTLIIHPSYEMMATKMAFQEIGSQTSRDTQLYWMYQALDRYLALDLEAIFKQ